MVTTSSKSASSSGTPWLGREVITSDDVTYPETGPAGEILKTDRSTAVERDGVTVLTDSPRDSDKHVVDVQGDIAQQISQR